MGILDNEDEYYMQQALREARMAAEEDEVPIGAVVVTGGKVIARAHNQTEGLLDATAHAEMLALTAAFNARGNWRLTGTTVYVTKEPCPMCAGALVLARPARIVWGVSDPKRGGSTVFDIFRHPGINHHPELAEGVLEEPCRLVLQEFFRSRRG